MIKVLFYLLIITFIGLLFMVIPHFMTCIAAMVLMYVAHTITKLNRDEM